MNFELNKSIELLERTPKVCRSLLYGMKYDWANINEGPGTWSAFDIVGHFIEGEKTDWIPRAHIILSDRSPKDKKFEPFDRFSQEEVSEGKTIEQLIEEFEQLRDRNLKKLRSWNLSEEDLQKEGIHPDFGRVSLKQLLATWTAHDMAHLNQLSRVLLRHYAEDMGPWAAYFSLLK